MRLIDADAYSADMKDRQEAAWKWRNEAIAEEDALKLARAEGAFTAFVEAKLTMEKHIINPWHRVEEELPPNAKHHGAFCPKYHVMTKWGVTDGWFNPDVGENGTWRVLLWFFQGTWDEWDIDLERGDKPKLAWVSQKDVFAWMPIEPL